MCIVTMQQIKIELILKKNFLVWLKLQICIIFLFAYVLKFNIH